MVRLKINQTVIKILSELKTRQSWHQMTLLIILQHQQNLQHFHRNPSNLLSLMTVQLKTATGTVHHIYRSTIVVI